MKMLRMVLRHYYIVKRLSAASQCFVQEALVKAHQAHVIDGKVVDTVHAADGKVVDTVHAADGKVADTVGDKVVGKRPIVQVKQEVNYRQQSVVEEGSSLLLLMYTCQSLGAID